MSRALLLVAHGSPDPRAQASTEALAESVRGELPAVAVALGYLETTEPTVAAAYAALAADHSAVTVVPLLFAPGFHAVTDLPAQLGSNAAQIAAPLGAHPLVAAAVRDALIDVGAPNDATVVLVAAGSREPAAIAEIDAAAALVGELGGWRVIATTASEVGSAVERARSAGANSVAVAPLLLAPGVFSDRIRDDALAAGADVVAEPIGAHPSIAVLVALRYAATTTEAAA
jgi:sirohydrochlorin ferrochelatase